MSPASLITPLPDETAGSFIWRVAATRQESVAAFCERTFGFTYLQARADLDRFPLVSCSDWFASRLHLSIREAASMWIDPQWLVSVFNRSTKRFEGKVRVCPACMAERAYGRRYWRTPFAAVCPRHGCALIENCPVCGAPIRYRTALLDVTPLLWLETWPNCHQCLARLWTPDASAPCKKALIEVSGGGTYELRSLPARWL